MLFFFMVGVVVSLKVQVLQLATPLQLSPEIVLAERIDSFSLTRFIEDKFELGGELELDGVETAPTNSVRCHPYKY